jgi:hypothetical protein
MSLDQARKMSAVARVRGRGTGLWWVRWASPATPRTMTRLVPVAGIEAVGFEARA